jgi:hypothetical protein
MAAIYSNGGNRWNILGFKFTKRDALSSVYKISMVYMNKVNLSYSALPCHAYQCIMSCPATRDYKTIELGMAAKIQANERNKLKLANAG